MNYIFSLTGIIIFVILIVVTVFEARKSWAGALSLPSMTLLTGIMYFFILPLLFVVGGGDSFYGLGLEGLPSAQIAMFLYMIGAIAAFAVGRRVVGRHPLSHLPFRRLPNPTSYWAMLATLALVVGFQFFLGNLDLSEQQDINVVEQISGLNFLNLAYSALIAMTVYTLVSTRFSKASLLMFVVVFGIFLLTGFRFRLVILCSAAGLSWCLYRRFRPGFALIAASILLGLVAFNAIGMARTYGRGVDISKVDGLGFLDLLQSVGGEIGPVFVLSHLTQRESDYLLFEPWYVAAARLVPSAIWPDKPYPDYLLAYASGFPSRGAMTAGIAGTQQAEFYMQFGWVGLPFATFGFFMLAIWVIERILTLSPDARIAGLSIMPGLIGFYAQQRGYAFQILCEYTFTLAPLFLLHFGGARVRRRTSRAPRSDPRTIRRSNLIRRRHLTEADELQD